MTRKFQGDLILCVLLIGFLLLLIGLPALAATAYGVYEKVVEKAAGSFAEVSAALERGIKESGWQLLAAYDNGIPTDCPFRARTFVVHSPSYAGAVLATGPKSAFALPLRAHVYEDEAGVHVAVVNPASINRTIMGDEKFEAKSLAALKELEEAVTKGVKGAAVKKQIGQIREQGRIGGIGGGDFPDKVIEVYVAADAAEATFKKVAADVKKGIEGNRSEYKLIYTLDLSSEGVVIYGVTKSSMESRSFGIAGEVRASKEYKCPGIDHAGAFPIEVIIYKDEGKVKAVTLKEMYRMKLYFEDAGNWAFMKNMRMPGQIEDEIVGMMKTGLGLK